MIRWQAKRVLVGCGLLVLVGAAGARAAATTRPENPTPRAGAFVTVAESQAQSAGFGMLMICPSHGHGAPDEAEAKLRLLLQNGSDQPATIWVCRSSQIETVIRFAPLVERVIVNPFGHFRVDRPKDSELYWPGINHPVLNGLEELRLAAGDRQLLACLDLEGEPGLFGGRSPSIEEIEWQVYAAIGTGYQGVVWRNRPDDPERASRLKGLEGRLREIAAELGAAKPVRWACSTSGQPASVLWGRGHVFVVLLNPDYVVLKSPMDPSGGVRLALEDREQRGEVRLTLPKGQMVVSARTLSGRSLSARMADGQTIVPYRFRGGGEIVICRLSERAPAGADGD
ncbi:MAG: hypothetical protein ACM359_03095 [Bacillota bacterium]